MPERLLTIREVGAYLGIPVPTLYQWRYVGKGPKAAKLGRHLRYRRADVEAWLDDQLVVSGTGGADR